jgi:hypothetical protein
LHALRDRVVSGAMGWFGFSLGGVSGEVEGVVLCSEEPVVGQNFDCGKEVGSALNSDFIDTGFDGDVPTWAKDFCGDTNSPPRVCPEIDASKDDWSAVVVESEVLPAVVHRAITTMIKES